MLRVTGAAAGGLILPALAPVGGAAQKPVFNEQDADEVECRRHLRLVFEALQRYIVDSNHYPTTLSDLVDTGYIDARLLLCPAAERRRDLSLQDPNLINEIDRELYTIYKYEYAPGSKKHDSLNRQRQAGAGDWVAIVRCNEHRDRAARFHLNLALNGAVYPSWLYWEYELLHLCPFFYLSEDAALARGPLPLYKQMPGRPPGAEASRSVDLTDDYNAVFSDPWMLRPRTEPLKADSKVPDSLLEFERTLPDNRFLRHRDVTFDVRGALVLDGGTVAAAAVRPRYTNQKLSLFPSKARPIDAELRGSSLHALVGCFYTAKRGASVGQLTLRYDSGREQVLPLRYGENIAATTEELESANDAAVSHVWSPAPLASRSVHAPRAVLHVVWEGLDPSQTIREIRCAAGDTNTCLFILALSTSG